MLPLLLAHTYWYLLFLRSLAPDTCTEDPATPRPTLHLPLLILKTAPIVRQTKARGERDTKTREMVGSMNRNGRKQWSLLGASFSGLEEDENVVLLSKAVVSMRLVVVVFSCVFFPSFLFYLLCLVERSHV